ncbi:MATE family efflux transporter [Bacillus sp. FJAT-49732]|uniref:Probable multidrug resistance protein NorM n=1 Tax=Lederbergia citrisecunda TaxID=2833583 RepID=A0A942TMT5_9BACI|nr:MATE family efflux transporter [Lederbergia citrisecunda]MBS4201120.1 MATE family efflux transporter [Lederbergia citrisecunda]
MMKEWKKILLLAIPSIASFASSTLTGTINLILVGQLGALAIAIVGVTNIVMYNAWALFSGIGHTTNYLVAQNYGSNNMKKGIERTYIAFYLCLAASAFTFLVGLLFPEGIFKVLGSSPEMIEEGKSYLQIRFFAMVFSIFTFVFHGFLRGIGDTKTPMISTIIGGALMVFFTFGLTYGKMGLPEIGLVGAGIAFFIGEVVTFLICAYIYFVKLHPEYGTRARIAFNRLESKLIVGESSKLGIQEFSLAMAMFVFTGFVTRLGTEALAANEIALSVMSFGFMPAFAFGSTATILVGQEIGKGKPLNGRRAGTHTAILGCIFILLLGTVEFFFAEQIAKIYTQDPQVFHLTAKLIMISAFLQIFDGLLNFYAGGLRGIGDTSFLLKISLILGWVLFVPLSYILTFTLNLGSVGAWISLYLYLTVFGISVMIRFYRTDWMSVRLKTVESE